MFIWRKLVGPVWLEKNETKLTARFGQAVAIIARPGRTRSLLEIAGKSGHQAREIVEEFGGRIEKLPIDWLQRCLATQPNQPLKVGKRLVITRSRVFSADRTDSSRGEQAAGTIGKSRMLGRRGEPSRLVIPAGAAFGTGEHATTAMSLRLLDAVTRKMKPGWSLLDVGTGSGIFALAAKHFGAGRVVAVDVDPAAIATARANARLNKLGDTDFRIADAAAWRPTGKFDIIMANLFAELLLKILPRLKRNLKDGGKFIVSGILRTRERELAHAMRSSEFELLKTRRRGKWIAILAQLK